ncbi:MAG: hypothetical protein PHR92_14375 [Lachnospiraceae bacterium]|nr:hypothetical protein [Lachnospiraceae bacterium]
MLKKAAKNKPISLNDLAENEQTRQMETIQALVSLNPQDNLAQIINSVEDILGSYGSKEQVAAFDEYRHKLTKKDIEVLEKFHNNNDYVGMNYWLDNKRDAGWRDILSGMYILTMAKLYQWGAETPKTKGNKGNAAKEDAVKKNDAGEGAGLDKKLMNELAESGVKYNADDVVMITKNADGKLLWLEKGNGSAGLKHIVDGHAVDFTAKGVNDIPKYLNDVLKTDAVKIGVGAKGPFPEYMVNGTRYRVAYGTNGYIVSFYPID